MKPLLLIISSLVAISAIAYVLIMDDIYITIAATGLAMMIIAIVFEVVIRGNYNVYKGE